MTQPERTNYWMKPKNPAKIDQNQNGTINDFSTVPKVHVFSKFFFYENCVKVIPAGYIPPNNCPPDREDFDIKGFSKKSRKNLFETFNKMNYSQYGVPLFLSATWHYDAPDTMSDIKTFLKKFRQMLDRQFPPFHYIWKLEYQERGAPHFHILLFPLNPTDIFFSEANEKFIKNKWMQLKICKCKHCHEHGMKVISCYTRLMSIAYIAKEIAKVQDRYEAHNLGRVWGTSEKLRCEPLHELSLNETVWNKILDVKLTEKFSTPESKSYVESMKDITEPRTIFIDSKKIDHIITEAQASVLPTYQQLKRYKLHRSKNVYSPISGEKNPDFPVQDDVI